MNRLALVFLSAALFATSAQAASPARESLERRIAEVYAATRVDFLKNPYFSRAGVNLRRDSVMSSYLADPMFRGHKQLVTPATNNATPWTEAELDTVIDFRPLPEAIFRQAVIGAINVFAEHGSLARKPAVLTVVDFDEPTHSRRFYVFDLKAGRVEFNSFTTHGSGSAVGASLVPTKFSNVDGSHASSLGFYLTHEMPYEGTTHYYDLALAGVDDALNSNAYSRAILVHSDDGMERESITRVSTLNPRSWGCFTLPIRESGRFYGLEDRPLVELVIDRIRGGSVLFAYSSVAGGLSQSRYLDADRAAERADAFWAGVEVSP